jgi:patatin-like phospholipase/acyl hydrolase
MAELLTVLAIDGGGIRGIIPATVLTEIETRTGKRTAELFDLVAGTSTGGILALGCVKPGSDGGSQYAASDLAELYEREGHHIFDRSLWHELVDLDNLAGPKYPRQGIEAVLEQYFGDAKLSEAVTETLVTSYELETREPWFFARHKARENPSEDDFPMRFVARATSAAPTYFEPEEVSNMHPHGGLIDGGVYANNPAMCAYVETKKLQETGQFNRQIEEVLVVSLGTGQHTRPIHYAAAEDWGLARWAKPILDVVFDGVSDTVDHQMTILCKESDAGDPRYYRFQTELTLGSDDLDDTSAANMNALKQQANELVEAKANDLDRLCRELTAKVGAPV